MIFKTQHSVHVKLINLNNISMRTFYFDSFMSIMAFLREGNMSEFTNSVRNIDTLFPGFSLSGYAIPFEEAILGIFIALGVYVIVEHYIRILPQERFRLATGIIHMAHTPLVLLKNGLEDIMEGDVSEETRRMLKPIMEHAEHVIGYSQSVMSLGEADWNEVPGTQVVEVELNGYVCSLADQCRSYADSRHIRMKISPSADYTSCMVNEIIMTVAIQSLLNKIVEITTSGACIYITVSHDDSFWKLSVGNCEKTEKRHVKSMLSISNYGNLRIAGKIIRKHGGSLTVYRYGRKALFQIAVPMNCHCRNGKTQECIGKECPSGTKSNPNILLVIADNTYGYYLKSALSGEFNTSLRENLDMQALASTREKPDAIIIDESVHGVCGDELCSQIRAEENTVDIPVILLIKYGDNKSYLSHAGSGADRLELRTVNAYRLRTDIHMLIDRQALLRGKVNRMLADVVHMLPEAIEKDDSNLMFIGKVRELLEKNLAMQGYTIDMLCKDMGMSRTVLCGKIKELTGKPSADYIFTFKMEKAKILLETKRYNITEIADMLGYCDAKYFGKKFKSFYNVCPTSYLKEIAG